MRQRFFGQIWARRVLLAGMVLVTIAVGFCLFDGDEHGPTVGHGDPSFDLCLGLAITSIVAAALRLATMHALPAAPAYVVHEAPSRALDPPPKSSSLP